MKKSFLSHAAGMLLLSVILPGIISCGPEPEEISFTRFNEERDLPLIPGATGEEVPCLHIKIDLLCNEGTSILQQQIRDSILTWNLGNSYTGFPADSAISLYIARQYAAYRKENADEYEAGLGSEDFYSGRFNHEAILENTIVLNDRRYLSTITTAYQYTGGAHGLNGVVYRTLDREAMKILTLADLFDSTEKLDSAIVAKIMGTYGFDSGEAMRESGIFFDEEIKASQNFLLDGKGIRWIYNPYEIAPYSTGTTEVFLTYEELEPMMKQNFHEDFSKR